MRLQRITVVILCSLLGALAISAANASASRQSIRHEGHSKTEEEWLLTSEGTPPTPFQEGELEGACGVAVSPIGGAYVSDYYRRAVYGFSEEKLTGSITLAGGDPRLEVDVLNAICGLAFAPDGALYANELHKSVLLFPSEEVIDANESTGVAVDGAGNLYVDDRTYVAVYEAPVASGDAPVEKIGLGSLGDGYGVAVDPQGKRVYVADASDDTVKVYEPLVKLAEPTATIAGPSGSSFNSLTDATLVVDGSSGEGQGHLLVADNLKPGAEDPEAGIYEFDASGNFLERLQGRIYGPFNERTHGPIFGEPSGMAVDPVTGSLYVTTGNSEHGNLLKYGPYTSFAPAGAASPDVGGPAGSAIAAPAAASATLRGRPGGGRGQAASSSQVIRKGPVQVSFDGKLTPHALPRHGTAPVGIAVDAGISATHGGTPPQLRRIEIAINRNGHFTPQGLPVCRLPQIQPSTTAGALASCRASLVGEGRFSANVKLPEQSPFPSAGKVLAFNGRLEGKPAILAHIYGTDPAPTSTVLPFLIRDTRGTYGTILETSLPEATGEWGFVTGLRMTLHRSFSYRGKRRSYLSAGCPAPAGFPGAVFRLARTSFDFAGGPKVVSVLSRSCKAKG